MAKIGNVRKVRLQDLTPYAKNARSPIEDINEDGEVVWKLSEREREVVADLNAAQQAKKN